MALGSSTVLHGWTYALLPPFRQLRVPARAIVLLGFAVAVLAAIGLEMLLHPLARRARQAFHRVQRGLAWSFAVLALVGVPLLGHAVLVSRLAPQDILAQVVASMGSLILFLLLLGLSLGWLALRRHRVARSGALGALAVSLIAFDLISLGAYIEMEPNDPLEGYRHEEALAFLRADPGVFRVETGEEVQGGWAPDWALLYGMDDLNGIWNPLRLGAYDVLTWVGIRRESAFYNLYNVKYAIVHKDTPVPAHFELAFDDGARAIYRNPRALPRAYLVYRARIVNGPMEALGIARGKDFDPAHEVVLDRKGGLPPHAAPLDGDPGQDDGRVEIVSRGPNYLDLDVVAPVEGYLFASEMWLPGWIAYVDGVRQEVARANYTFRAIHIPAGVHEVRMVYRPSSWIVGLGLTMTTLAALLVWGVVALARARQDKGGTGWRKDTVNGASATTSWPKVTSL